MLAIGLAALLNLTAAEPQPEAAARMISAGEQVARRNCAECHAIEAGQASPLADAPTFSLLRGRFSRDEMAEILDQRMRTIHPRMPQLDLDVDETEEFLHWWGDFGRAPRY